MKNRWESPSSTKGWIICCWWWIVWLNSCCYGFAPEMVERSSMCWTELSTTSVVMNYFMIAESESRNRNVKLEISHDGEPLEPESEEGEFYTYKLPDSDEFVYTARLVVSPSSALPDLQYIMDFTEGSGGEFSEENYNVGCDKRRAHGRRNDSGTKFKITKSEDNTNDFVELRAGWATEHEAVTLVKSIRFYPSNNNNNNKPVVENTDLKSDIQKEAERMMETLKNGNVNNPRNDIANNMEHAKKALENMKRHMPHSHMTREEIIRNQIGDEDAKISPQHTPPKSTTTRKFRQRYDHTEFGKGALTMKQYLLGLAFLIVSYSVFIFWASNQSHRSMKGRRNL